MTIASNTTTGKYAQSPSRLTLNDIPAAIERFCAMFPDGSQPSVMETDVTRDGRHIIIANAAGTLAFMTTRGKFVERIGGTEMEGGQQ